MKTAGRLACGPLVVEFRELPDRVAHALLIVDGSEEHLVAESHEGDGEQDWPPSPPLQQLSWETDAEGRRCALLVGMAGISHWSASVIATDDALRFELACRAKQPPERLVSTYRLPAPIALHDGALESASGRLHITPLSNTQLQSADDLLSLNAVELVSELPSTVCWSYEVRFRR